MNNVMNKCGNDCGLRSLICVAILLQFAAIGEAATVRQVTDLRTGIAGPGALDDAGAFVFSGTSTDQFGTNPRHTFQIVKFDAVTAAGTTLTNAARGVTVSVSVSDDGQWLAFVSPSDMTGQNHDLSPELFVMKVDGSGLAQLTNDPAVNAGSVGSAALSGNGLTIAFTANTNPLGSNTAQRTELFTIKRDGSGLKQLTMTTSGSIGGVTISDDGSRITFTHTGNLTGGNADSSRELFAINADGTNLRQLTNTASTPTATLGVAGISLAGGGSKIAFQSNADLIAGQNSANRDEIFVIDWLGTGLRQLTHTTTLIGTPAAQSPSITDDGQFVVFHSNLVSGFTNLDSNYEIWKIKTDGTGLKALTNTAITAGCLLPTISGNGSRIAFYSLTEFPGGSNPDGSPELHAMDGNGLNIKQLSRTTNGLNVSPAITRDGTRAVYSGNVPITGGGQLFRLDLPSGAPMQLTNFSSGGASNPTIAADGVAITFDSSTNATGQNLDGSQEIFFIRADGNGLKQLTSGPVGTTCENAAIAAGGSRLVFQCDANLTGGNADGSVELFTINPDGTGLAQLTNGAAGTKSQNARISDDGASIVFESNANLDGGNADGSFEIFTVRADGSGLARWTGDAAIPSRAPDISGDGARLVYAAGTNPLSTNPEGNVELFAVDTTSHVTTQLTQQTSGSSSAPHISGDGNWVYFVSDAPIAESDPDTPSDLYRVRSSGGAIARVGALRAGGGGAPIPDGSGNRAVFSGAGDLTEANPDLLNEIFLIDLSAPSQIRVGKSLPTIVSWDHEAGPIRYDLIRGDVAAIAPAGSTIDLGATVCLENDSPDASSAGFGDATSPPLGHAFFYLYRGSAGLNVGPGSYGSSTDGRERVSSSCSP